MNNSTIVLRKAAEILKNVSPLLEDEVIWAYVRSLLEQRQLFLDFAGRHSTPVYLFDENVLLQRAEQFTTTFSQEISGDRKSVV